VQRPSARFNCSHSSASGASPPRGGGTGHGWSSPSSLSVSSATAGRDDGPRAPGSSFPSSSSATKGSLHDTARGCSQWSLTPASGSSPDRILPELRVRRSDKRWENQCWRGSTSWVEAAEPPKLVKNDTTFNRKINNNTKAQVLILATRWAELSRARAEPWKETLCR